LVCEGSLGAYEQQDWGVTWFYRGRKKKKMCMLDTARPDARRARGYHGKKGRPGKNPYTPKGGGGKGESDPKT